jgi:hypothetical protein
MMQFFLEGGWGMFPVLIVGLIVLYASIRYLIDGEPVRLRFLLALTLAQLALVAQATVADVSAVLNAAKHARPEVFERLLVAGFKECTRPALLGFGLLALSLILVAIGVYRVGVRELRAARGR